MIYLEEEWDLQTTPPYPTSFLRRLRCWVDKWGADNHSRARSQVCRMPLGNTGCSYSVRSHPSTVRQYLSGPRENSGLRCAFRHASDDKFAERRRPTFRTNKIFDPSFEGFATGLIVIGDVTYMAVWIIIRGRGRGRAGCPLVIRDVHTWCVAVAHHVRPALLKSRVYGVRFRHASDNEFAEQRRPTFRTNEIFDPSFEGFATGRIVIGGVTYMRCVSFL
jgi:hypothetical protein